MKSYIERIEATNEQKIPDMTNVLSNVELLFLDIATQ